MHRDCIDTAGGYRCTPSALMMLYTPGRFFRDMRGGLTFLQKIPVVALYITTTVVIVVLFSTVQASGNDEVMFTISRYVVKGNTLLDYRRLQEVLDPYTGPERTASDVEKARKRLEDLYHAQGYPTILVNIPRQNVEEGVVYLEVIESTIGEVRVTGNRYYTKEKILEKLPSFRRGEVLYVPEIQQEVNKVNRPADLKVTPLLMPGRELGTTDVELKVEDHFPLHGSVEINNRSTNDTTGLRLNNILHYDNLWQSQHSLTLQYQTSPQDTSEVQVYAGAYTMPSPWNSDHIVALYAIISDSDTAFGEGFLVNGKGNIYGLQYVIPLPFLRFYSHSISLELDYKDFDESLGYEDGDEALETPVTYLPVSLNYQGSLPDSTGVTMFRTGLSTAFRGVVTDEEEFEAKRYKARGDYIYVNFRIDRDQHLPAGFGLKAILDGRVADQPLISNEQYLAGGMESVRGYKEGEAAGDNAWHTTAELSAPDIAALLKAPQGCEFIPYVFFDYASLRTLKPLSGQDERTVISGAGLGVRGGLTRYVEYECDFACALRGTDTTDRNDHEIHFRLKGQF